MAVLRFGCVVNKPLEPNFLRGGFGNALRKSNRGAYDRLFAPKKSSGPSGLRDAPRPFVLRARGCNFDFYLFDPNELIDPIAHAFGSFLMDCEMRSKEMLRLPLTGSGEAARVRVEFKTPTELKGAESPEFGALFARIRDRVSTLRALYQGGPLKMDFKAMGERASQVQMTRCEIGHIDAERTSRATGETHSIGGFVGVAEYEGALGEFLPYLEIARWTGVGRQTVWGKGEIHYETL